MNNKTTPFITYKKWYHRFIPSYRRNIKFMNLILSHEWEHGMDKKVKQMWKNVVLYGKSY